MKEKIGEVFSVTADNVPIPGCTVSKSITADTAYYSLASGTDISAEIYPYFKLFFVDSGEAEVYFEGKSVKCSAGECVMAPYDIPVGVKTDKDTVYTEITIRRESIMNKMINAGEVFKFADLVPYSDGKIVNMDVVSNEKMKFVVMAFDEGCALSEHAAPGDALIFALDGEGIIGYEGKENLIKVGEAFRFAKGGRHYVKATAKFKMALLITLEN